MANVKVGLGVKVDSKKESKEIQKITKENAKLKDKITDLEAQISEQKGVQAELTKENENLKAKLAELEKPNN